MNELVENLDEEAKRSLFMLKTLEISDLDMSVSGGVTALIQQHLSVFDGHDSLLRAASMRLTDLHEVYRRKGSRMFVVRDALDLKPVACAGVGPFRGLPVEEGVGEIRDLTVEESYRGQGLGKKLLARCMEQTREFNYQRVYLETTPSMIQAQKLFEKTGFKPVKDLPDTRDGVEEAEDLNQTPCYYVLEFDS